MIFSHAVIALFTCLRTVLLVIVSLWSVIGTFTPPTRMCPSLYIKSILYARMVSWPRRKLQSRSFTTWNSIHTLATQPTPPDKAVASGM